MPQNPVMVYAKEDGTPMFMHTVDAAEAVRLGDYTPTKPGGEEVSPEARASAMSRFKTGQGVTHPELQTEEERERTREEANEKAEMLAGVPEGAQVVVMAPSPSERSQRQTQARASSPPAAPVTHETPSSPPPPPPPSTPPEAARPPGRGRGSEG